MAQRFLFFNSIDGDRRRYQAQDFAEYFGSVLSSGLLHTDEIPGMSVSVEAGTMNTVVTAGKAIMRGHLYENTAPVTLNHRIPEPTMDRIDRIVLRLDSRQSERNILLHIKEGESSTSPVPPNLQRDNTIYEISLAQILIERNTSTLRQVDLTDERLDEDLCGLVHSLISIPTSQFQAEWDLYFNDKKDEIDTESADFLQQLADDLIQFNNDWDAWFSNQQTEGFVMANEKGEPGGIPVLDSGGTVPINQLPPMDYVPLSQKGEANGVATLGSDGMVPNKQLGYYSPSGTIIEIADDYTLSRNNPYAILASFDLPHIGMFRIQGFVRRSGSSYLTDITTFLKITIGENRKNASPEVTFKYPSPNYLDPFSFSIDMNINAYEGPINLEGRTTVNSFNITTYVTDITFRGSI